MKSKRPKVWIKPEVWKNSDGVEMQCRIDGSWWVREPGVKFRKCSRNFSVIEDVRRTLKDIGFKRL